MTCSRMGEAVGLIGSRRRLWRELTGRQRSPETSGPMRFGINFEQVALTHYETVLDASVARVGFMVHPYHEWIGGSPDGLVMSHRDTPEVFCGGVEVKCPQNMYSNFPPYYMTQVQGLMEVSNLPWWDFMAWTPDAIVIKRVQRSREYWDELYPLLCEFWAYVEFDVEPPMYKRGFKPGIKTQAEISILHME